MYKCVHFFGLICLFNHARAVTGQNCSEISVTPSGKSSTFIYALGIQEISFVIGYNCTQTNIISLFWRDMTGSKINNSTITLQDEKFNSSEATLSASNESNIVVTLHAIEIPSSQVNITNKMVQKVINITIRHCIDKTLNIKKTYNESYNSECNITDRCVLGGIVKGQEIRTCGEYGNFINTTICNKREYEFNISADKKTDFVNVPVGTRAVFKCIQRQKYSVKAENFPTQNVSYQDHGRKVYCVWTEDTDVNNTEETSNITTFSPRKETSYVIIKVLSIPSLKTKAKRIYYGDSGSELFLNISFWARSNTTVTRSDLTVYHNGNKTDDYYFKPGEIFHDILFHYQNVDAEHFGNYIVSVRGRNEFCEYVTKEIEANFADHGVQLLHTGYIVSIALGSVLLIVLIVFIVMFALYRKRWSKGVSDTSKNSTATSATNHANDAPKRTQNNYHPPKPDPAPYQPSTPQSSQQYQNHDSQFDTDDDEFEDDYEPMDPTERPPMPIPPVTRTNHHQQQRAPRSPLPSVPPTRTLPGRELPPARVVPPPPAGHNRGEPRRLGVAPPPPRSRVVAPPPAAKSSYVNNRRPHKPYDYAGQEYEESDFQQESYEVPVSNYR